MNYLDAPFLILVMLTKEWKEKKKENNKDIRFWMQQYATLWLFRSFEAVRIVLTQENQVLGYGTLRCNKQGQIGLKIFTVCCHVWPDTYVELRGMIYCVFTCNWIYFVHWVHGTLSNTSADFFCGKKGYG